ncbi:permease [Pannus brasiliensis CCIBt3594]|uniref:Permease n=1 Tax=Pannus brasiliensis CCIBt3594 TaxID=1427578 RepID=A0AAW9QIY9_9CHRO
MSQLQNAFTLFLSLLVEAVPFLLFGVILSSTLLIFIDERKLIALMPRNALFGAFVGSCIGFLFPVCECGNVPVARRLLLQGTPNAVAVSFLLAAPTINPIVIWSTWVAFRDQPEIVVYRVIFSLFIATVIGCVFSVQRDPRPLLQTSLAKNLQGTTKPVYKEDKPVLLQSGSFLLGNGGQTLRLDENFAVTAVLPAVQALPIKHRWRTFVDNVLREFQELGGVLVIGSAIAACLQVFVPRELILNLGQDPVSSIVAMMLLAVIVSICSTVDSFFALSFASSFTSSSLLAFLVFGPMIDLKAIGLLLSIFKPRMLIYLFALAAQLTFLLTLVHSYVF